MTPKPHRWLPALTGVVALAILTGAITLAVANYRAPTRLVR